jgi:hypothetical protein
VITPSSPRSRRPAAHCGPGGNPRPRLGLKALTQKLSCRNPPIALPGPGSSPRPPSLSRVLRSRGSYSIHLKIYPTIHSPRSNRKSRRKIRLNRFPPSPARVTPAHLSYPIVFPLSTKSPPSRSRHLARLSGRKNPCRPRYYPAITRPAAPSPAVPGRQPPSPVCAMHLKIRDAPLVYQV